MVAAVEDMGTKLELTSSQIKDPYPPLSTQQTTHFLAQYGVDHACNFPIFDATFETMLIQIDIQVVHVSELPQCLASTTKCMSMVPQKVQKLLKKLCLFHKKSESKPTGLLLWSDCMG